MKTAAFLVIGVAVAGQLSSGPTVSTQEQVEKLTVDASPAVFSGSTLPTLHLRGGDGSPNDLSATSSLTVRYFDDGWNEVKQADAPGRYGALVQINGPDGTTDTRHVTLFRLPDDQKPADPYSAPAAPPNLASLLLNPGQWSAADPRNGYFDDMHGYHDSYAGYLAGLDDLKTHADRLQGYSWSHIDSLWWDELEKRTGLEKPYARLIRTPDGYDADTAKKWPLILFLHGSGERGTNVNILRHWGPPGYADAGHPLPFIVVSPQCLKRHVWNPDLLGRMLDEIEKSYRVDTAHVYVTGLSMGGIGSIDTAAALPGRFAALACMSGGEEASIAQRMDKIPAWFMHGANDGTVPLLYATTLADAMKKAGSPVKMTILPGVGHGGWDKMYANPDLYTWFLQYSAGG